MRLSLLFLLYHPPPPASIALCFVLLAACLHRYYAQAGLAVEKFPLGEAGPVRLGFAWTDSFVFGPGSRQYGKEEREGSRSLFTMQVNFCCDFCVCFVLRDGADRGIPE
jgi:hypothetical protein